MTKNSKIALGVVGALAAGVVIGLLVAPEKGKDLRNRLKKNAGKWGDQLSNLLSNQGNEGKQNLNEKMSKVKEAVS